MEDPSSRTAHDGPPGQVARGGSKSGGPAAHGGPPGQAARGGSHSGGPAAHGGPPGQAARGGSDSETDVTREIKTHFRVCRFIMESGNRRMS